MRERNPWHGLEGYVEGEILYGRDTEIRILSQSIANNVQTVLYGKTGIGKSSLINAGIFPLMRHSGFLPITLRLNHKADAPSYVQQIKEAIFCGLNNLREEAYDDDGRPVIKIVKGRYESLVDTENQEDENLWEFYHRFRYFDAQGRQIQPLLVLDQFEEIFYDQANDQKRKDFFSQLASLLNEVMPESSNGTVDRQVTTKKVKPTVAGSVSDSLSDLIGDDEEDSFTSNRYTENSEFRLVIAIREDYLAYLEHHTENIPSMKQNRYFLQPMKVEEAKKVILRPAPDLVTEDVANSIIQKITSESKSNVASPEDCVVDPFVLSLFCHELNKRRMQEGASQITLKLVNEYGNDILQDFYKEKMKGLQNPNTIRVLEEKLMTSGGHRIPLIYDIGSNPGIPDQDMNYLLTNRIIKQENYDEKTFKIEFAHDVLCKAASRYKEYREKQKIAKSARRAKFMAWSLGGLLLVTLVGIMIWTFQDAPSLTGQTVTITITTDPTTINREDNWKVSLTVKGERIGKEDSTIVDNMQITTFPEEKKDSTYTLNIDSAGFTKLKVYLNYDDYYLKRRYAPDFKERSMSDLKSNANIRLTVRKSMLVKVEKRLYMPFNNQEIPLQDALVILGNQTANTDDNGWFTLMVEDSLALKDLAIIAKRGFEITECSLPDSGQSISLYPKDSLKRFYVRCEEMDTIARKDSLNLEGKWNYKLENSGFFKHTNGDADKIKIFMQRGNLIGDYYPVKGFFYYVSEYRKYTKQGNPHLAYRLLSGSIDKDFNSDKVRYIKWTSYDYAYNKQTFYGQVSITGSWSGHIESPSGKNLGILDSSRKK